MTKYNNIIKGGIVSRKGWKEWTVLIFANGNNELEPEIQKSKIDAENSGSNENVNVIMQIGRIPRHLVEIMRPEAQLPHNDEEWSGVRRYKIKNPGSILISDLGSINMADPLVLYNFIKWGFKNYPSRRKMLIIGGHGFSFVSVTTDFSQGLPYMMGISQMCQVINMAMDDLGESLDVLILDACYMNSIEIIYELGRKKKNLIKYLLTYIKDGPLEGLPYGKLISSLKLGHSMDNTIAILKDIVDKVDMDLVIIEIDRRKLRNIKGIVNSLAYTYLTYEENENISPKEIIYTNDKNCLWYSYIFKYRKFINEIIIYYKFKSLPHQNIIDIAHQKFRISGNKMDYIALIYLNLSFCRNNSWVYLLTDKSLDKNMDFRLSSLRLPLEPMIMHPKTIGKIIGYMNAPFTQLQINNTMEKLFLYKNWNYKNIANNLQVQIESILPRS